MRTIFRNATNRVVFRLREDPAELQDAVALFRQNGRIVLEKGKEEITVQPAECNCGCERWTASVTISAEESARFDAGGIGFAQIVALRESGVQDPGEIYEFDICDTVTEHVRLEPGKGKRWENEK